MKKFVLVYAICLALITLSCEQSVELDFPEASSDIIVDGWIEQGKGPRVILTRSLPYFSSIDSASFRDLVVSKAKVTVSVDSMTEILTLHYNEQHFPPYVYQGFQIKGEVGKRYVLKAKLGQQILTAETYIPEPPAIDSLWTITHPEKDTLQQIMVRFKDDPETTDYYRFFSRIQGHEDYYKPAYGSVFHDHPMNGSVVDFPLFKGYTTNQSREDLYFTSGDTVWIKFCTLPESCFAFWKNFQAEQMNAVNPFASSANKLEGNIQGKGRGVWTGYGADYGRIILYE